MMATLDHSIWFYEPFDFHEPMLFFVSPLSFHHLPPSRLELTEAKNSLFFARCKLRPPRTDGVSYLAGFTRETALLWQSS